MQVPCEIVKALGQEGAYSRDRSDLPGVEHGPHHQHGNQIEESQRDLANHGPVQHRDGRNQNSRFEQEGSPVSSEESRKHKPFISHCSASRT